MGIVMTGLVRSGAIAGAIALVIYAVLTKAFGGSWGASLIGGVVFGVVTFGATIVIGRVIAQRKAAPPSA
jgi:hypothetical protein